MKRIFLKAPAFGCMTVYLVLGWNFVSAMMSATTRNFNILFALPCIMGAVVFFVYGLMLDEHMPSRSSVTVGLLNLAIGLSPYMLFAMLLSPKILTAMPPESWKDCVLPMLLSVYPFATALWQRAARKRERTTDTQP